MIRMQQITFTKFLSENAVIDLDLLEEFKSVDLQNYEFAYKQNSNIICIFRHFW